MPITSFGVLPGRSARLRLYAGVPLVVAPFLLCAACGGSPTRPAPVPTPIASSTPPPEPPKPPTELSVTRFVAFGDSLTEGGSGAGLVPAGRSYPDQLRASLQQRYPSQSFVVLNRGRSGERAMAGTLRLPDVLRSDAPQVLLLMEGTNELNDGKAGIPWAIAALETMTKDARGRGVRVLLATLPPQRPGSPRGDAAPIVPLLNAEIRRLAAGEGAVLVDVFEAFGGDLTLLGADGLHPTEEGYERIAAAFLAAIASTFETRPAPTMTAVLSGMRPERRDAYGPVTSHRDASGGGSTRGLTTEGKERAAWVVLDTSPGWARGHTCALVPRRQSWRSSCWEA